MPKPVIPAKAGIQRPSRDVGSMTRPTRLCAGRRSVSAGGMVERPRAMPQGAYSRRGDSSSQVADEP
jgi:hypothetical protein